MKKIIGFLLTLVVFFNAVALMPVSASDEGIMTCADNYISTSCAFGCSISGYATVTASIVANSATTGGTIYTYIQKLDAGVWETINNGQPNNKWEDTFDNTGRTVTHHMYLPSKGTYRAVAVFYVRGTAGIAEAPVRYSGSKTYE